jgi:hypothetical protein
MSNPSGTWESETSPVDDPLQNYQKRPIISEAVPNTTYVGRVIIELWEDGSSPDDKMIAMTAEAVNGRHPQLLDRIAAALAKAMQRGNPLL